MSDPIRAQFEEDEATQDSRWPMETSLETNAMNPETGAENEQVSAKPLVVRTLKPPPEIWDMVHETPEHFNPGGAFVARLTSTKTNLVLLTLTVMLISGLCAYAIMTLSDGTRGGAAAQVQEEPGASQSAPATQANAASTLGSAPASELDATDAQLNTSPGGEYSVDNTQPTDSQPTAPEPADPLPTDQEKDNPAAANHAVTDSIQPTGVNVSNISKRATSGAAGALSGIKPVTVTPGGQNADRSPRRESEATAVPDTTAPPKTAQTTQPPQTADIKVPDEKSSGEAASAKKRSDTASSPQATAPPATSSTPKAKVIQWP